MATLPSVPTPRQLTPAAITASLPDGGIDLCSRGKQSSIQLTNVDLGCYESATKFEAPIYLQGTPGSQSYCVGEVAVFTFAISNVSPASLGWLYNTWG